MVKLWGSLLHKYIFNCHTTVVWLPRLRNLTIESPWLTGAGFSSTSEVWTYAILKRVKLRE